MIHIRNLNKKTPYRLAISAGVDSVAAAHLLHRLGYKITLCHFNHFSDKPELNDKMEEAARQFAFDHKLPIYIGGNTEQITGGNLEAKFRAKRLEFFKKFDGEILVCQHLNDCMESFIPLAFSGRANYCPIPIRTRLEGSRATILRPFMLTEKSAFVQYAERNDLNKYIVFDESNLDTEKYRRNYIRHELLTRVPESLGLRGTVKKQMEHFYKKDKETQ